jgi:hypothetical protein
MGFSALDLIVTHILIHLSSRISFGLLYFIVSYYSECNRKVGFTVQIERMDEVGAFSSNMIDLFRDVYCCFVGSAG